MAIRRLKLNFKKSIHNATSWFVVIAVIFSSLSVVLLPHVHATTGGQMKLYFHKEASDINETYNSLSLTPPEPAADTAPGTTTSTTNINASPPTSFCESTDGQTDAQNERIASAASTGNRCMSTFISMPIGNAISIGTGDGATAISSQLWSSESATQVASALSVYLYRWNGSGTTVSSTDRIATLTCAEPGTSATSCTVSSAPANNITFAATDRIVAIVADNVTTLRSGNTVNYYFDSDGRAPTSVTLKYTALAYNTSNKPGLTGSMDDDFTNSGGSNCSSTGVAYNNWTCLGSSAASVTGSFGVEDTAGASSFDESSWLQLSDRVTTTSAITSNFGTTPSNTFIYQPMPTSYGDGNITTVVNSTATFGVGAGTPGSPFNHVGLVLWTSNTDYLELQVYSTAATTGTNSVNVALNNSGTIGTASSLNSTTTTGIYGEVWLRITNTSGTFQGQYSTNGTTWNNVGSSVSHTTAFTRVGLNAFTKIANPVNTYTGAFEWFSYGLAAPTYNQTSYQYFDNIDNKDPASKFGSGATAMNTPITLASAGQQFRLRQLIKTNGSVALSGQSFKEQYADLSTYGSCSAIPSGNWLDLSLPFASAGPNFAGTGADDSSNGGNISWTNLSNITATDGSYAAATFNVSGDITHYLKATNFGFSIPAGSTINGITATVNEMTNATNVDTEIKLIKAGVIQSTNRSTGATWPAGSFVDRTYGGASDLWGTTWTPSDINSSNFGFALSSTTSTTGQARVDSIKITINYTTSGNVAYYDNATPNSGNGITATGNDPSDSGQTVATETYQESNPFNNGAFVYGYTVDAEWDFSLFDNSSTAGTTYCFRSAKSDGTALNTYTNYPMVTIFSSGGPPTPTTDQLLRGGQWFNSGTKQPFYWAK